MGPPGGGAAPTSRTAAAGLDRNQPPPPPSPLKLFIRDLSARLASSPPGSVHRVVVPALLSPTAYSGTACRPEEVLQFLHALRALLRRYAARLTALITLPVTLFPRSAGLTRWAELLSDGVLELVPLRPDAALLAHHAPPPSSSKSSSSADDQQQKTQGLLRVHALPVFDEKGGGSPEAHAARQDQSFAVSRSRGLVIRPFSLPPVLDDDNGAEQKEVGDKAASKKSMEF